MDNIHKRQAIVKRLLAEDLIDKDILEIGCGAGTAFGSIQVTLLSNFRYLGTDLSEKWVKGMETHWKLKAVQAGITEIPTEADQFDVVVALDTLEHVRPEDRALGYQELRRVMKPGAKLLINMPLEETLHNLEFDHRFDEQDISAIVKALSGELLTFEKYTVECADGPRSYAWVIVERGKNQKMESCSPEPKSREHELFTAPEMRSGIIGPGCISEADTAKKKVFEIRTPWDNAWIPIYKQIIEEAGHTFQLNQGKGKMLRPDIIFHMWADNVRPLEGAVNYVFMRRYELYSTQWLDYDWAKIDKLIFCNHWIMERAQELAMRAGVQLPSCELVMNAAAPDVWTFKERGPGKNIGMACHVHPKKNLPLAAQIMLELDEDYRLHIAGDIQDPFTADYVHSLLGDRVRFYGHIPRESLDTWWDGMNYCLSTSISEGNPNSVIEAMAKGVKPVVHCWPGAAHQFDTFKTVFDAVKMLRERNSYDSAKYRNIVTENHGLSNYRRIVDDALTQRKG
jgi:SAM-dependent methyltransferase